MLRPAAPVNVLELMPEERAELLALLRRLAPDDWNATTACPDWNVHDLGLHLLGNDLSILSRTRDGHTSPGTTFSARSWDALVSKLDRLNEEWVRTARRLSPALLIELLEFSGDATQRYFEALDPNSPGDDVAWAGLDETPNWLSVGREFTERWVHQQQIRDATEKPGLNGPRYVSPVLALFMRGMPPAYAGVDADADTSVAISVEGRAGGNWVVRKSGDEWVLFEGRSADADAAVSLDQDTAWRYLTRNIDTREGAARMTLEGDNDLARRFLGAVAAIVTKA
jgi:uncharacterized protein (TIGR03083 family)